MELIFFLFLSVLGIVFYWLARKSSGSYQIVYSSIAIGFFLITAFLIYSEGITQTYGVTPTPDNVTCTIVQNCTNAVNGTCSSIQSCVNAYSTGNQLVVTNKNIYSTGVGSIFVILSMWIAIEQAIALLNFKKEE
jgi:hypothetical protein